VQSLKFPSDASYKESYHGDAARGTAHCKDADDLRRRSVRASRTKYQGIPGDLDSLRTELKRDAPPDGGGADRYVDGVQSSSHKHVGWSGSPTLE